ncbi:fimbrial isopeptide formation D2 domain-containing protein [Bifidobacterium sp. DSM 109960]|uniref:Fimbrial isopeptide formation D2 domain-containing protein n=1 Tax=Bifidobacterium erythrocebi TaxID=2675325 RepID=A0A7Y0HSU9_9BIFI|nr:isopeptide-forming domain-containing fimbrial protein [Bifidobacterium sp. DSM 109960]NMM95535.1 fimbrial isopeptide formation D2 domain-containing protein [Bifidobacterium sp. DSM 109960]
MNSITKRLLAGVAAAATLLSGMALTGSAMAADTAINTADVTADQTLTVKAADGVLAGKNLYAVKLASYSAAQTDGEYITGYDLADGGYATAVDTALNEAGISHATEYSASNPMVWVVQHLLDSSTSPYSGQLRDFLTKLANQQTIKGAFVDANKMIVAEDGNTATKSVPAGIYAVFDVAADTGDTVVSIPMLNGTTINGKTIAGKTLGEVDYKATNPTVDKKIVEGSERVDSNVAAIGDTITYELTTTIPNYTGYDQGYYLALNDTLSKGLTFGQITSVKVEGVDTEYKDNATFYAKTDLSDVSSADIYNGGKSFSILFAPTAGTDGKQTSDITKQADLFPVGKRITVQYTATLNANAVIGQDNNQAGNPNKVNLTYSRNPNGTEQGTTEDHAVKTYTGAFTLHKVGPDNQALAGAHFSVTKGGETVKFIKNADDTVYTVDPNGSVTEVVTPVSGTVEIKGLNGEYAVKETSSPLGATALPAFTVTVTVSKNDGSYTVTNTRDANQLVSAAAGDTITVKNVRNLLEMPKTGATWLAIYAVMAVLCGAGAFLLLRSKKNA